MVLEPLTFEDRAGQTLAVSYEETEKSVSVSRPNPLSTHLLLVSALVTWMLSGPPLASAAELRDLGDGLAPTAQNSAAAGNTVSSACGAQRQGAAAPGRLALAQYALAALMLTSSLVSAPPRDLSAAPAPIKTHTLTLPQPAGQASELDAALVEIASLMRRLTDKAPWARVLSNNSARRRREGPRRVPGMLLPRRAGAH